MNEPGAIIGQAVVNVRACRNLNGHGNPPCCVVAVRFCPSCQGNGTYLDTTEATAVERCEVWEYDGDVEVVAAQGGDLWCAVEKGDSE